MRTLVLASLGLVLACAHAREAEDPSRTPAATSEPQPDGEEAEKKAEPADPEAPAEERKEEAAPAGSAGEKGPAQKEGRVSGGSEDPGEVPVASSPGGLLKPGAEQTVRDKLGVKKGGSMRGALQKFQKEHDLPATGILDHRTAEALGLDPDDLFERASGQ
jgi:hypothetical protein